MAQIVVDNCTLVNFAAVGQLSLLRDTLRDRGCWTQAIEYECKRSSAYYPSLSQVLNGGWLGEAIELDSDKAIEQVENVRRALSNPRSKPTENLGEAEAIYAISAMPALAGAILLTDDTPAADHARFKGIHVMHSMHLYLRLTPSAISGAQRRMTCLFRCGMQGEGSMCLLPTVKSVPRRRTSRRTA